MRELLALLLLLTSCATSEPAAAAIRLMDAWETGDVSDLADFTAEDVVYDDYPNARRIVGREEVAAYVRHVHSWASDVRIEMTRLHSGRDCAVAEWTMTAVQDRPIPGRVPVATDRRVEIRGVTLVEVRDGRITRAADYLDALGFVIQLGGRVALPGGASIP